MTMEQQVAVLNRKLDLLLAYLVPTEDIQEVELEAQYLELFSEVGFNPGPLREFVQNNAAWVANRNKKQPSRIFLDSQL